MILSEYWRRKQALEDAKCSTCRGFGQLDDAEPGDMDFRTWTCQECQGTGLRAAVPKVVYVLKEDYVFNTRSQSYPIGVAVWDEGVAQEWASGGKWAGSREYDAIEVHDVPPVATGPVLEELIEALRKGSDT